MIRPILALALASALPTPAEPAGTNGDLVSQIGELTQPVIDAKRAQSIVVGVLNPDGSRVFRGFGRVTRDSDARPDENTVYEIGSITKTFTGTLFADAIEDGLMNLDDPITKFLPDDLVIPDDEAPVLLWHLVTHTSGLQRVPGNRPLDPKNPYAAYDEAALFEFLEDYILDSEPGVKYAYSNLAMGLLGQLIVRARSAENFDALVVDRICKPLGLKDTRAVTSPEVATRLAAPSGPGNSERTSWDFDALAGCGAIRSTAADMLRFAEHQFPGGESSLAAAIERSHTLLHPFRDKVSGVAYGWHVEPDGTTIQHNGGTGGYASMLLVDVPGRRAVIALSSSTDRAVDKIGHAIMKSLKSAD